MLEQITIKKMKLPFLKIGAKGKFRIQEQYMLNGEANEYTEHEKQIEVLEIRTRDFIVLTDSNTKKMYCSLPRNAKDGSETWELIAKGFIKTTRDGWKDSRGQIDVLTTITYQF